MYTFEKEEEIGESLNQFIHSYTHTYRFSQCAKTTTTTKTNIDAFGSNIDQYYTVTILESDEPKISSKKTNIGKILSRIWDLQEEEKHMKVYQNLCSRFAMFFRYLKQWPSPMIQNFVFHKYICTTHFFSTKLTRK